MFLVLSWEQMEGVVRPCSDDISPNRLGSAVDGGKCNHSSCAKCGGAKGRPLLTHWGPDAFSSGMLYLDGPETRHLQHALLVLGNIRLSHLFIDVSATADGLIVGTCCTFCFPPELQNLYCILSRLGFVIRLFKSEDSQGSLWRERPQFEPRVKTG